MKKQIKLSDIIIKKFQALVHDNQHMHQILTSGRAGTKSSFMAILVIFMIVAIPNTAVVVMRKHHNKLRKTVYKECIRAIGRLGLSKNKFTITKSPMQITYNKNGNTVYFTGSDSIDDTKGMIDEERKIRMVVLDELTEFFDKGDGEDEITNIVATFIRGNDDWFRMLYLFNPPKNPKAPVNVWAEKMSKREDCIHIHTDYRDVPIQWLGKKLIDEAEAMKKADPKMYEWIWLGIATGLDDVIYYMFDEEKHIKEPLKEFNFYGIGVDYGQMNPTTYQAYQLNIRKKRLQGCGEYHYCGRDKGRQKSPSDYAKDCREFIDGLYSKFGKKAVYMFIDPSAKGLSEEIKRACPEVIIKDADNTVALGIQRVQKLLSFGVLSYCKEQKNQIDENYQYRYDPDSIEKGKEVPIKENDHCVVGDTLVNTTKGIFKIKELVGKKGRLYSYDQKRKKIIKKYFFDVRKTRENVDVYKLTLLDDSTVTCTSDHLILTDRGYVKLKDLMTKDKVLKIQ